MCLCILEEKLSVYNLDRIKQSVYDLRQSLSFVIY